METFWVKRDLDNHNFHFFLWKIFYCNNDAPLLNVLYDWSVQFHWNTIYNVCANRSIVPLWYAKHFRIMISTYMLYPSRYTTKNVQIIENNGKCKYRIMAHLWKSILLLRVMWKSLCTDKNAHLLYGNGTSIWGLIIIFLFSSMHIRKRVGCDLHVGVRAVISRKKEFRFDQMMEENSQKLGLGWKWVQIHLSHMTNR